MDADRCLWCDEIIPEGIMVCPTCEQKEVKVGTILQTINATKEEIEDAYNRLYAEIRVIL